MCGKILLLLYNSVDIMWVGLQCNVFLAFNRTDSYRAKGYVSHRVDFKIASLFSEFSLSLK